MTWSPAQIQAFFTGLALFVGAVVAGYIKLRLVLKEIHVMVNSNLTDALARITQLEGLLKAAISTPTVPVDPPPPPTLP